MASRGSVPATVGRKSPLLSRLSGDSPLPLPPPEVLSSAVACSAWIALISGRRASVPSGSVLLGMSDAQLRQATSLAPSVVVRLRSALEDLRDRLLRFSENLACPPPLAHEVVADPDPPPDQPAYDFLEPPEDDISTYGGTTEDLVGLVDAMGLGGNGGGGGGGGGSGPTLALKALGDSDSTIELETSRMPLLASSAGYEGLDVRHLVQARGTGRSATVASGSAASSPASGDRPRLVKPLPVPAAKPLPPPPRRNAPPSPASPAPVPRREAAAVVLVDDLKPPDEEAPAPPFRRSPRQA